MSRPNTLVPDPSAPPATTPGEARARNGGTSAPSASSVWDVAPTAPASGTVTPPATAASPSQPEPSGPLATPTPSPTIDPPRQRGPLLAEPTEARPPAPPPAVTLPPATPLPTTPTARRKAKARRALEVAAAERAGAPTRRRRTLSWWLAHLAALLVGVALWALFVRAGDEPPGAAVPVATGGAEPAASVASDGATPITPVRQDVRLADDASDDTSGDTGEADGEAAAADVDTTVAPSAVADEPVADEPVADEEPSRAMIGQDGRRSAAETLDDDASSAPVTTAPAPTTTAPATTAPATTITPATTTPVSTTPVSTVPPTTVAPVAVAPVAAGPRITIEPRSEPCKYGSNCLVAGFSLSGFPGQPDSFVCEFADGSRYTIPLAHMSVRNACATGTIGGSITIEIDGVRSDTVVHG